MLQPGHGFSPGPHPQTTQPNRSGRHSLATRHNSVFAFVSGHDFQSCRKWPFKNRASAPEELPANAPSPNAICFERAWPSAPGARSASRVSETTVEATAFRPWMKSSGARSASRVSETTVEAPAFMPGKIGKKNAGLQPRRPSAQTAERKSFGRCSMLTHHNSVFAFVSGHDSDSD